jgi:hypothetical protein
VSPSPAPTSHVRVKKEPLSPPNKAPKHRHNEVIDLLDDGTSDVQEEVRSKKSSTSTCKTVSVVEICQTCQSTGPSKLSKKIHVKSMTTTADLYDELRKQFAAVSEAFQAISVAMEDLRPA